MTENDHLENNYLTPQQYEQLLKPVNPGRVMYLGKNPHMEAYEIRAHLTRIFGFGRWSADVIGVEMVKEWAGQNSKGKEAVNVVYRAGVRLTICAPDGTTLATYTEWAAGDALGFPLGKVGGAHDFAIKTAESQALKRCAINLGDQFGLSLYNAGSVEALVKGTKMPVLSEDTEQGDVDDLPEIKPEDTGEHYDADTVTQPDDVKPLKEPDAAVYEAFNARLKQVYDNANGLNALRKWARNSGLPAEQINEIDQRLKELGK